MKASFINSNFFILCSLALLIDLSSCKKHENKTTEPVTVQGGDSSLLIKSIRYASIYVEDYYYDSINNKIILTSITDDPNFPSSSKSVLSYNEKHLLTGIIRKIKPDNSPDSTIELTVTIDYDDQGILQKIEEQDLSGSIKSSVFSKIVLAPGTFELSWLEPGSQLPDGKRLTDTIHAVFNDSGQLITKLNFSPYPATGILGDTSVTTTITKDSFLYDNTGSLVKVLSNYTDTFRSINDSFTYYQFTSRLTKGDNLFNQRRLLLRGISKIPFSTLIFSDEAGVLSIFNDIEAFEYSKYPFQSIVIHNYMDNDDFSFSPTSEFDGEGRLTYFRGFTLLGPRPSEAPYALDFHITYYK